MSMVIRLLGEVSAAVGGHEVDLGPARQRCVLAVLAFEAGDPVTGDELIERVWGEHAPVRAAGTLRSYLSRLRAALDRVPDVRIERTPFGYVCRVDREAVDVHRFRELVGQARGADSDEQAAGLFGSAFMLWRGEPFASLDSPWLAQIRAALAVERFTARLDHIDVELRLGRDALVLPALAEEVAAHPLDERLAAQYLLAMYRSGQQAEALEHYQRFRRDLADQLGVDPGPALRELHSRVLSADPALRRAETPRPTPRQLPLAPRTFTGRHRKLEELTTTLSAPGGVVAIVGQGGVGKTWLALRWAHQHTGLFPDGQLYADLRGWSQDEMPVTHTTVVRRFLDALGVPTAAVPDDPAAQVTLYRSLLADKRMLVLLDNARDSAQVSALLPGGDSSVVVTSRDSLVGLVVAHGLHLCPLEVLDTAEAERLLESHLGRDRLADDRAATDVLLEVAAGLPLALGVLAAQLAVRPKLGIRWLAAKLHDSGARLDVLDYGGLTEGLRAVFAASTKALRDDEERMFRLLGTFDLPDFTVHSAAALSGGTHEAAQSLLEALESTHLLEQHVHGRYRMHDLVRLYAAELGHEDTFEAGRRLVDFYLHTALSADRMLHPYRPGTEAATPDPAIALPHQDQDSALRWFQDERLCIPAVQRHAFGQGLHTDSWRLAWAVTTAQRRQADWQENAEIWKTGVAAAGGDPERLAVAHRFLGLALARLGGTQEALEHLERSLSLAEKLGDQRGQAHSHYALTQTLELAGELDQALTHANRTCQIYEDLDAPAEQAHSLNSLGWCHARTGDFDEGERLCARSLELHRDMNNDLGIASASDSLGYIAYHAGRHHEATQHYETAARVHERLGDMVVLADVLARLSDALHANGDTTEAARVRTRAVELFHAQHRIEEANRAENRQRS
ncbi:AfsR/SARP family transcriptional regulator [Amycolatopsis sp. EV170708-02-1]|uniref:AfsR/SARP family transcriptional regulator n=1 Tax=Amycolatopsis sp. EV170708-02-1 TaxID=2919322 RepID=UPI001F0C3968|nr:AfsR/SARP family transcriptional regulator [Amycolatopsis sp. EV170708-02-1]UMP00028.1 tetratricopeptide repeat protein [Amycolatopsis sp. EV170708-02-1]